MSHPHRRISRIVLYIAFMSLVVAGCNLFGTDDDNESVTPVDRHRGTPDSLLQYFGRMTADPARDEAEVSKCLHPDFRFYFTESDRTADPTLPEYLTREEFVAAVAAMQDSAASIDMTVSVEDTSAAGPCDPADSTGATCQAFVARVSMAVGIHVPWSPEGLTLLVNGLSDFYVTRDPGDPELWVIHDIYDRTSFLGRSTPVSGGAAAIERQTWSGVVALYFERPPAMARATPQGLWNYFARMTADPNRNSAEVAACLHPDCRFFFTETDRTADPTLPEFFDRARFVESNAAMMSQAISISMSMVPEHAPGGSSPCDPVEPGGAVCDSIEVRVALAVGIPYPPDPQETLTLLVNGLATLTVTPDPADPRLWVIHDIVDRTNVLGLAPRDAVTASPAVEPSTWGHVIALFD